MIKTIPNTGKVQVVVYHPGFSAVCSVGKAPFHGTIEIKYYPAGYLLEFMSFEKWLLAKVAVMDTTVEELCRVVFDVLYTMLDNVPLSVTVHALTTTHAPVSVRIKTDDFYGEVPMDSR